MISMLTVVICLSYLIPTNSHFEKASSPPKLLVISFDGFRWNYLERTDTPHFDVFLKNGAHSKNGLKNAFITKTFPNHYTLATGMWEESHGIVANTMYDPKLNEVFTLSNKVDQTSAKWFDDGGEPVWVTNQLQNSHHRSGIVMWPGGGAPVKGVNAVHNILFDPSVKNNTRVDTILDWFTSTYPINLGLLYFEQPDEFGHQFGPDSSQVTRMIGGLDEVVGYLLKGMKEKGLLENTNVIITSDHGFSSTPPENVINLDKYIDPLSYKIFSSNPIGSILPNEGLLEELYANLTAGSKAEGHFKVYKKDDIPDRYHYTHNDRIMPLLVVPEDTYQLTRNGTVLHELGNHGWDNSLQDMHPFFLAMGPSFKAGASVDILNNVDVYPLMCHLLGLEPAPNNGSLQNCLPLLKTVDDHADYTVTTFGTYILILIFIALIAGVFMVAACRQHRYLKRKQKQLLPLTSLHGLVRYATPPNGAKIPLLSDTDEEDEDMILD
ncbi:ectonucleotide pyrophosphatase/phosphodiesterase family member 5-like [Haliotis rufescens]|uniref:ectonucleotide pyrophosphatase/phosphodiesterase family member 5-like n=1 Tax=Haliotis rufescens TaxID=6454 RepID=UPI00201EC422|nr:ectonucleotide pyrophosphatase/phosphodiesterase family member 5-like [Haliotis rufescens]